VESKRPLRVSFVIDRLSRAGTETQLLAMIRCIDRSKVEPSLVLLDGRDELSRSLEPDDCPVLRLETAKLLGVSAIRAARCLVRFWSQNRPDIVQSYFLDSCYFSLPLARVMGIRATVRVQNNLGYWLTPRHRLLNRLLRRCVARTVTNSESGRDAILRAERLLADKVAVIENGVDLECHPDVTEPMQNLDEIVVGCVANLRPVKNIKGLLRVAKDLCERFPCLRFSIAGDGEQRDELERLRTTLGLGERVVFLGSVANVPAFLRTIDIAVLPSHSEGMSNALLEYLAAGRAVVATDVGANARLLDRGACGLLVAPNDDNALRAAIARLLNDPRLARFLAAAGRARVEAEFGREAMCRRFERFYRELHASVLR